MPLGPSQKYSAVYNTHILPGYVQRESFSSDMDLSNNPAMFSDGSISDYIIARDKPLFLSLKVWEQDYAACKEEAQRAATILRTNNSGYAPLYVQYADRYYEALTKSISIDKQAGTSVRILDYDVEFTCKPWLTSTTTETLTGTATLTTNQASRTLRHGGWTPTIITITGTDVTVSGYTDTEPFTGFMGASGSVTNLVIDSENFTATESGLNRNNLMTYADYRIFVGPSKTSFDITGASSCTIEYKNRWYI